MDKDQERIEKYKSLNEVLQNLYGAPESGATMYRIFQKVELTEDKYKIYAEIIGDVILGFNKVADLPQLFQQQLSVSADQSQKITSELIEFLSPVVQREGEDTKVQSVSDETVTETTTENSQTQQSDTDVPSTTIVEPLRTMEGDINRIHGYGAYREKHPEEAVVTSAQEDVLKKKE